MQQARVLQVAELSVHLSFISRQRPFLSLSRHLSVPQQSTILHTTS